MKYILPFILLGLIVVSCSKKEAEKQAEKDEVTIREYIASHNLDAVATGSGLYYVIDAPGTGAACDAYSSVTVSYTGYLTNGEIFDQSDSTGISFNLQQVIEGWTEGIPYFREGGSGKLLIPSALGYGPQGSGPIPGNTVLIFDVALLDVL